MDDPQPHGQHINERDPRPTVPIPTNATNDDDNSDAGSDYASVPSEALEAAVFVASSSNFHYKGTLTHPSDLYNLIETWQLRNLAEERDLPNNSARRRLLADLRNRDNGPPPILFDVPSISSSTRPVVLAPDADYTVSLFFAAPVRHFHSG